MPKDVRALLFLFNSDIDHLYSLSMAAQSNVGTFSIDSIRMKSSQGIAGNVIHKLMV